MVSRRTTTSSTPAVAFGLVPSKNVSLPASTKKCRRTSSSSMEVTNTKKKTAAVATTPKLQPRSNNSIKKSVRRTVSLDAAKTRTHSPKPRIHRTFSLASTSTASLSSSSLMSSDSSTSTSLKSCMKKQDSGTSTAATPPPNKTSSKRRLRSIRFATRETIYPCDQLRDIPYPERAKIWYTGPEIAKIQRSADITQQLLMQGGRNSKKHSKPMPRGLEPMDDLVMDMASSAVMILQQRRINAKSAIAASYKAQSRPAVLISIERAKRDAEEARAYQNNEEHETTTTVKEQQEKVKATTRPRSSTSPARKPFSFRRKQESSVRK